MIPVVVLTGFLGSGKTTLLNALLAGGSPIDGKLAVIVNEFGSVGIDGDLLPADMARQVELPGGCVCCLLDDDLGETIVELLASDPAIAMIVLETTGIAEPLPISWTLAGEALRDVVRLAAVVTTVDVLEHDRHRPLSPSVDAQVIDADILALTKTDLAETASVDALCERLRQQNDHAPILRERLVESLREIFADPLHVSGAASSTQPIDGDRGFAHSHVQSVAIEIGGVLDFEELTDALQDLPENYLRIKGIADVIDGSAGWNSPVRAAFHRVGARVSIERFTGTKGGEPRLVAVGYELDANALEICVKQSLIEL